MLRAVQMLSVVALLALHSNNRIRDYTSIAYDTGEYKQ